MRFMTIVGARPQFIKAAPVSRALADAGAEEILVHTGQHYDPEMSEVFFEQLDIARPAHNLGVGSGSHGSQTGRMLAELEELMLQLHPDGVIVYGDTNSTLAGAIAAVKLELPLAHVEAGLRSYNRSMPEEHNRVLADHAADILFCPTRTAVDNLSGEGIVRNVHLVGDTMYDAVLRLTGAGATDDRALQNYSIDVRSYVLATIHRPYNADRDEALLGIVQGLAALDEPVVFPVHPRTLARIQASPAAMRVLQEAPAVRVVKPVGYLDMLCLERNARVIVTDSGGVQKEAYFLGVPCVTVRPETEWIETLQGGWNRLAAPEAESIASGVRDAAPTGDRAAFGDGEAAQRIVQTLLAYCAARGDGR